MSKILVIGLGGLIGAISRYFLSEYVHRVLGASFPYGTLCVNVLGCMLAGCVMFAVEEKQIFSPDVALFITVGVLGAFTTFSTFGYETVSLLRQNHFIPAMSTAAANVLLGLTAVWLGRSALRVLIG